MLHTDAKSLREHGDQLFKLKEPLDLRNQEIAENFYVERADFTVNRTLGADYAEHLMTGYPVLMRRDLGNAIGSMLRPRGRQWFKTRTDRPEREDHEAKMWLDWATGLQRRAMYDRKAQFTRATKETDMDFSAFGSGIISVEMNWRDNALLYRCWHPRDCAWSDDSYGQTEQFHRNWKPSASELCYRFPKTVHPEVTKIKAEGPSRKIKVRHVVISSEAYDWKKTDHPYVSLFIDCENNHILEEIGSHTFKYVLPRWMTVSGSQYAYSPAAVVALPDARLLQAMTLTLLDAGERAVNPPLIGVSEAIRGDLQMYPGGFTAVDAEYDERLGDVLRPVAGDSRNLAYGLEMADRTSGFLREAFYLNTLSMPPHDGPEMTAFEVGQRVQEYIRNALPLFEPVEADYNGAICDMTFETLMHAGAFGSPRDIPESIRGAGTDFDFESPLAEMIEREKGAKFLESKAMVLEAESVEPGARHHMDFGKTLRDVLTGIGTPPKWLRSPEDAKSRAAEEAQAAQDASMLENAQKAASATADIGRASESLQPTPAM